MHACAHTCTQVRAHTHAHAHTHTMLTLSLFCIFFFFFWKLFKLNNSQCLWPIADFVSGIIWSYPVNYWKLLVNINPVCVCVLMMMVMTAWAKRPCTWGPAPGAWGRGSAGAHFSEPHGPASAASRLKCWPAHHLPGVCPHGTSHHVTVSPWLLLFGVLVLLLAWLCCYSCYCCCSSLVQSRDSSCILMSCQLRMDNTFPLWGFHTVFMHIYICKVEPTHPIANEKPPFLKVFSSAHCFPNTVQV